MGISRRSLLRSVGTGAGTLAGSSLLGQVTTRLAERLSGISEETNAVGELANEALQVALVRVPRGRQHLLAGFDDTHHVTDDGRVEILLWPGDLARLVATGLAFDITVDDLVLRDLLADQGSEAEVRVTDRQPGETSDGAYRRLADYEADLAALASRHPDRARLIELPHRTLEGRRVLALEIADDVHAEDGRPTFYNDGLHHAREWPSGEIVLMWAFDLLEHDGPVNRRLLARSRNLVVPVVNPDGFHHSREVPIDDRIPGLDIAPSSVLLGGRGQYWRKNRRTLLGDEIGIGLGPTVPHDLRLDAHGTDPNRNYGYEWGDDVGGSSGDVLAQTYRGAAPFSEPEAQNIRWLLTGRQVTGVNSHHTHGDLILWPWGDTTDDAPDDGILQGLGRAMAVYNGYRPQKSVDLYVTTGTTIDWAYGALGALGYTFEHAGTSFHPAYESTVPAMYERNRDTFRLFNELTCLRPEDRDLSGYRAEALEQLRAHTDPTALHHAVVTGRVVTRRRRVDPPPTGRRAAQLTISPEVEGRVARLELTKRFDTRLWKRGDGSNPARQASIPEQLHATMVTADDGRFVWHVNPSTQPAVEADGGREHYTLTARTHDHGTSRELAVRRGEVLDLGDLTLG